MKSLPIRNLIAGLMIPAALAGAQPAMDGEKRGEKPPSREDGPEKGREPRERGLGKGWKEADADNSGTLTKEEFANLPRLQKLPEEKRSKIFERLDKDQDGSLSEEELKALMRPPHEAGRAAMMKFRELDTDGSGGVSLEEMKAGELFKKLPPDKLEALFARLDTDKDGEITIKDKPPGMRDGPGRPDKPERGGRPDRGGREGEPGEGDDRPREGRPDRPPRDFHRMLKDLDVDQDGEVTFAEFRKAPHIAELGEDEQEDRFESLDKNGDKKLNGADFTPPPPKNPPEGKDRGGPSPDRPDQKQKEKQEAKPE